MNSRKPSPRQKTTDYLIWGVCGEESHEQPEDALALLN